MNNTHLFSMLPKKKHYSNSILILNELLSMNSFLQDFEHFLTWIYMEDLARCTFSKIYQVLAR